MRRRVAALLAAAVIMAGIPCAEAAGGAVARMMAQPAEPGWGGSHVPGQLLVKVSDVSAADALLARSGVRRLRSIPQLGLALVATPPHRKLEDVAADLVAGPAIEWAEPNYTFSMDFVPNDPFFSPRQAAYLGLMEMPAAWDYSVGRPQVIIAILDTGIAFQHPDLAAAQWVNLDEIPGNHVDDDVNGFVDDVNGWDFAGNDNVPDDDYGHGTHVAGIAAARLNNGLGMAGVAGAATLMAVDVFTGGIGAYEDLIRAIVYATDNGAQVINMSLGASSYSLGEEMAVDYAWSHGVVVVAAAGNSGQEAYHYPAAHEHAIAVSATTSADTLAGFSTRGSFVDVAAPGASIYSTMPASGYSYLSGTSMATPHVSGLAALILARNPRLTPDEVRHLIEANADDRGATGWDSGFGHGRINARRSLAATLVDPDPFPAPDPHPPLVSWPEDCVDLIDDGGFEGGTAAWHLEGDVVVDATRAYAGTSALHFAGGQDRSGVASRFLSLPARPVDAVLWFAYRIETTDFGAGVAPSWPYDDWLKVEFRREGGESLAPLLRTGNTADSSGDGLAWDRYLFRMQLGDGLSSSGAVLAELRDAHTVALVLASGNDEDSAGTDFWIDQIRFCVTEGSGEHLPLIVEP